MTRAILGFDPLEHAPSTLRRLERTDACPVCGGASAGCRRCGGAAIVCEAAPRRTSEQERQAIRDIPLPTAADLSRLGIECDDLPIESGPPGTEPPGCGPTCGRRGLYHSHVMEP